MEPLSGDLDRHPRRSARPGVPRVARPRVPRAVRRVPRRASSAWRELARAGFLNEEFAKDWHEENEEGLRGGWDAARRDKELDADGVVGEIIFPDADSVSGGASAPFGAGLGATGDTPGDLLLAGARAHNRWLAELCNESPERRAGVAIVPIMVDIDAAVAEIRRAHSSGLRGGILIPPMWQPHEPYHHAQYDPVWAMCEELSMPVHVHSGVADRRRVRSARRHLHHRDPVLVVATAVVPHLVRRVRALPGAAVRRGRVRGVLGQRPALADGPRLRARPRLAEARGAADGERCRCDRASTSTATASSARRTSSGCELARRYEIGVGNLCWGNDFPHPEGTWPHTREFLANVFCDIPSRRDRGHARAQRRRGLRLRRRRPGSRSSSASDRRPRSSARPRTRPPSGPTPSGPAGRGSPASRRGRPRRHRREHGDGSRRRQRSIRSTRRSSNRRTTPYALLRDDDPVHWSELLQGWVVTRFDDVAAILRDPSMSSDIDNATPNAIIDDGARRAVQTTPRRRRTIVHLDDPDHARVRRLMAEPFRVREVSRLTGLIDERVADALDRLRATRGPGARDPRPDRRPRLSPAGRDLLGVVGHARGGQPSVPVLDQLGGSQSRPNERRRAR